jgi:predicted GH43/DUF377 family glycosyl hydrolase
MATRYSDGRPSCVLRLDAVDQGRVLRHGDGPARCDFYGARDPWIYSSGDTFYLHYDGAGDEGWLCCLATSHDLLRWTKVGKVIELGESPQRDCAAAQYGVTYYDGADWHMFYAGARLTTPPPDRTPAVPYYTLKARSQSPAGPWVKQPQVTPFSPEPGTYYQDTTTPGPVVRLGQEYLMIFSAAAGDPLKRTLGIARTRDLNGPWRIDPAPMLPPDEQIENASLYFEPLNNTWFCFTNHVGFVGGEYTDAVWVYWTRDLNVWHPDQKAVVLDGANCTWSFRCIGLPTVLPVGSRLALIYDAAGGESVSHIHRDLGLAWLQLPLKVPQ